MKKKIISILLLAMISSSSYAGTIWDKNHDIDKWAKTELKKAEGVTSSIREVYAKSYKKWDVALNKAYKALMKRLPEQDKLLLRESQRKWISYRDSEFVFMQKHIRREGGNALSHHRR